MNDTVSTSLWRRRTLLGALGAAGGRRSVVLDDPTLWSQATDDERYLILSRW
jgi:hypothetical protein